MSRRIKEKYRLSLLILLSVVFVLLAVTAGNFAYEYGEEYARDKDKAKASLSYDEDYKVWPSGEPIGIYVKTKGVMVIDVGAFETEEGYLVSPCEGLIRTGDYIEKFNGDEIKNKSDFMSKLELVQDTEIILGVLRDGEEISVSVKASRSADGDYKLGLWVKDDIAGIGTLTFVDKNGFAALGHSINDNDTGEMFQISEGAIYNARIVNIVKPSEGTPGKLEGIINYAADNMIGRVETNESDGISGYMTDNFVIDEEIALNEEDRVAVGELSAAGEETEYISKVCNMGWVSLGDKESVSVGSAYIISCVSGERCAYSIEIEKVNKGENQSEKNMEIRVTDERLLELTGGIVQGMSGSPIIQNGRIIGAVTHVFVNDPTRGYGIFIENMLEH